MPTIAIYSYKFHFTEPNPINETEYNYYKKYQMEYNTITLPIKYEKKELWPVIKWMVIIVLVSLFGVLVVLITNYYKIHYFDILFFLIISLFTYGIGLIKTMLNYWEYEGDIERYITKLSANINTSNSYTEYMKIIYLVNSNYNPKEEKQDHSKYMPK